MWITCWFDTVWTPQQLAAAQLTVFEATTGMVIDVSPDTVPVGMVRFFFCFLARLGVFEGGQNLLRHLLHPFRSLFG